MSIATVGESASCIYSCVGASDPQTCNCPKSIKVKSHGNNIYDIIMCIHDKYGCANKQTNRHGNVKQS